MSESIHQLINYSINHQLHLCPFCKQAANKSCLPTASRARSPHLRGLTATQRQLHLHIIKKKEIEEKTCMLVNTVGQLLTKASARERQQAQKNNQMKRNSVYIVVTNSAYQFQVKLA